MFTPILNTMKTFVAEVDVTDAPYNAHHTAYDMMQATSEPSAYPDNAAYGNLYNQHGITEGEKSIPLLHRSFVRFHDVLFVVNGRHQHE